MVASLAHGSGSLSRRSSGVTPSSSFAAREPQSPPQLQALQPNGSIRDVSATDLAGLQGDAPTSRLEAPLPQQPTQPPSPATSRSSSNAEWQHRSLNGSEAAARPRAAAAAGVAAGAAVAAAPLPAPQPSASPQLPPSGSGRDASSSELRVPSGLRLTASRQSSGDGGGELKALSARSAGSSGERASGTWLSRVTAKTDDLRATFGLPSSEVRIKQPDGCTGMSRMTHPIT